MKKSLLIFALTLLTFPILSNSTHAATRAELGKELREKTVAYQTNWQDMSTLERTRAMETMAELRYAIRNWDGEVITVRNFADDVAAAEKEAQTVETETPAVRTFTTKTGYRVIDRRAARAAYANRAHENRRRQIHAKWQTRHKRMRNVFGNTNRIYRRETGKQGSLFY